MGERKKITIRDENNEIQEIEVLIDDIEITPEMEEELASARGGEE